jgi:hypothetical protein
MDRSRQPSAMVFGSGVLFGALGISACFWVILASWALSPVPEVAPAPPVAIQARQAPKPEAGPPQAAPRESPALAGTAEHDRARVLLLQVQRLEGTLSRCEVDGGPETCADQQAETRSALLHQLSAAEMSLRECLEQAPERAACHLLLGSTLSKKANWMDHQELIPVAKAHYERFLALAPEDPAASRVKQFLASYAERQGTTP